MAVLDAVRSRSTLRFFSFKRLAPGTWRSFLAWLMLVATLHGTELVRNANFIVITDSPAGTEANDDRFARDLLARAEERRERIAREWLGRSLPKGLGRTVIHVEFTTDRDSGLTWAMDGTQRKYHNIYLHTRPEMALSTTLDHEIAHTVLATRFAHPKRLPEWVEEGIASRYDDDARKSLRQETIQWWKETGDWPSLETLMTSRTVSAEDTQAYTSAASLVEFLLTKGDRPTFLAFAVEGSRVGWTQALSKHYGIQDSAALQQAWVQWLQTAPQATDDLAARF